MQNVEETFTDGQVNNPEFIKIQFQETIELFRSQLMMLVQAGTFLLLADVTVIGYAMNTRIAGILFIGTLFPIMLWFLITRMNQMMLPVLFTALSLEHRYGDREGDWLASTFLSTLASPEYQEGLRRLTSIADRTERMTQLRQIPGPLTAKLGILPAVPLVGTAGHLVMPVILSLFFGWRVF
jgi:hypothetical protein